MWRKQSEAAPSVSKEPPLSASPARPFGELAHSIRETAVPSISDRTTRDELTQITQGITIKGQLSGESSLYLDGKVEGNIQLKASKVLVGPEGSLRGDVQAREIVVRGNVHGDLDGRDRIVLSNTSEVRGDLTSQRITIEDGARFKGKIETVHGEKAPPARAAGATAKTEVGAPSLATIVRDGL